MALLFGWIALDSYKVVSIAGVSERGQDSVSNNKVR